MLHLVSSTEGHSSRSAASAPVGPVEDELVRLAIVKRYEILDTPPEEAFDRITALAADLFGAPIAILSFVGLNRVSFKSHHGLGETEVSRGPGASGAALDPWIRGRFKNGFHVSVPLCTSDGYELGKLSVVDRRPRHIDEQQVHRLKSLAAIVMDRLDLRLAALDAARHAEMMSSEVDHRAMNSLQLIASLLHLQSRAVSSPATSQQLTAAANRVLAVARVHRAFSIAEPTEQVPIVAYLGKLCGELSTILGADIKVEGVEASVSKAHILAIGLVVNELVTNAKKHGGGQITVALRSSLDGQHELCVLDEGPGLPEGFAADRPGGEGIGMKVVSALVAQLHGRISAAANPAGRGSCFAVAFPTGDP
jgi:two-component sensor histidine kinase